jgi:hypothetical protein
VDVLRREGRVDRLERRRRSGMSYVEFEQMLAALLPSPGKSAVTITELPESDVQLAMFIERAIACGERRSSRLTGIHLPRARMDAVRDSFRQVPVEDCGAGVMRLVFES